MEIKFLKATNGDSILISFKDDAGKNRNILIDGGPKSTFSERNRRTKRIEANALKQEIDRITGINQKIDLLILTHVDDDHIDGILSWFESSDFEPKMIGEVWFNSGRTIFEYFKRQEITSNLRKISKSDSSKETGISQGDTFEEYLEKYQIWNKEIIKAGDLHTKFGIDFRILSPSEDKLKLLLTKWKKESSKKFTGSTKNDYEKTINELLVNDKFETDRSKHNGSSIAFVMTLKNKNFIFLGDAHVKPVIDALGVFGYNKGNPIICEFVKVSHHGSEANTSESLMKSIETNTYIISTNGTHSNLPNKKCLARIIKANKNARILFNYPELISKVFSSDDYNSCSFETNSVDTLEYD